MSRAKKHADSVGAISALLCIIHCLLLPILLTVGVLSDSFFAGFGWELLDWLFVGLALLAVWFSTRRLQNVYLQTALWLTLLVFSVSVLLHEYSNTFLYLSVISSVVLMLLHALSYRRKHQHQTQLSS